MVRSKSKNDARIIRHERLRRTVKGAPDKPRLAVFRSLKHIYAQIIDDEAGVTIVSASTLDKELKGKIPATANKESAKVVGSLVAKRALEKGISAVVFDRGGHLFHGCVRELALAARESGLKF